MSEENKRKVKRADSRFLARDRLAIFAGKEMPATIVLKELINNTTDVISERSMVAKAGYIKIGPSRITVMDNGTGISTEAANDDGETHLWLSMAEMFTSSNYDGVEDTTGSNGVGLTIASMTAISARALIFPRDKVNDVEGYAFTDGYLNGSDNAIKSAQKHYDKVAQLLKELKNTPEEDRTSKFSLEVSKMESNLKLAKENLEFVKTDGDYVKHPINREEAIAKFNPAFQDYSHVMTGGGFMIDEVWAPTPNEIFDDEVNMNFLYEYLKAAAGEISGMITVEMYKTNDFTPDNLITKKEYIHDYIKPGTRTRLKNTVTSWEERVAEAGGASRKMNDNFRVAFFRKEVGQELQPMVQGNLVLNSTYFNYSFNINGKRIHKRIPYSFYYRSKVYPNYTDQTKVGIVFTKADNNDLASKFEVSPLFQEFYKEAEMEVLADEISSSKSEVLWPALGPNSEAELIIGEGHSSISGIKQRRDPITQACIGMRGKIKNTWRSDLNEAIKSPFIKEILNEVMNNPYKQIIIACDADPDGMLITTLLLGLFANYTNLIQSGKVKLVYTPHYIFNKPGEEIQWSEDPTDVPKGYTVTTNKGIGALTEKSIEYFITNKETRVLTTVLWNPETDEAALDLALSEGGKSWIGKDETLEGDI